MRSIFFSLGLLLMLSLSGCELMDSITQKFDEVKKVQQTVQELQENIEKTKNELDTKLQQITEAQEAISKVFGASAEQKEIENLRKQALELQEKLELLEYKNSNHLEDTSEFSIEE